MLNHWSHINRSDDGPNATRPSVAKHNRHAHWKVLGLQIENKKYYNLKFHNITDRRQTDRQTVHQTKQK